MSVIIANRSLAVRHRRITEDSHGDRVPTGFTDPTRAMPGLAQEQPDTPLGQPGGRTWVIDLDERLWPVKQQDMIIDVDTGQQWNVTSAQLLKNEKFPQVNHVRVEARLFEGGSKA